MQLLGGQNDAECATVTSKHDILLSKKKAFSLLACDRHPVIGWRQRTSIGE
jgi:hypothetical protein